MAFEESLVILSAAKDPRLRAYSLEKDGSFGRYSLRMTVTIPVAKIAERST